MVLVPARLLELFEGRQVIEHQYNDFDMRVMQMGPRKLVVLGTEIPGFGRVQFFCGTRERTTLIQDWVMLDLSAIDVGTHAIPLKPEVGTFKETEKNGYSASITIYADLESLDQPLAVIIPADHPLRSWFRPMTLYQVTVHKRDAEEEPA